MPTNEFLKEKAHEDHLEVILEFERAVGLPEGFSQKLLDDDDWSFIIKIHALLEAAVAHSVLALIGRHDLDEAIARLPLNGRTGKLTFLEALDPIDKAFRRFVDALSQIRNKLVHDVRNADFDLEVHVRSLPPEQQEKLRSAFADTSPRGTKGGMRTLQLNLFLAGPKAVIFHIARFWIARLYLGSQHELLNRIERSLEREEDAE